MDGVESWLDEDNSSNRLTITFTVPAGASLDTDFKYELIVTDVGRLDPVVRVKRR